MKEHARNGYPRHDPISYFTAAITRLSRSAMLDILDSEYIKMARIKGVPEFKVILKHGFRNAMIPVVTLAALNIVTLLNGTLYGNGF
jgi:ABC-type dipeptide/oligopeptide/nickel transport system permease component